MIARAAYLGALALLTPLAPLARADPNSRMCIKNTGGSCAASECYSWRENSGSVDCDAGRCFCNSASCAGIDGVCYNASHEYQALTAPNVTGETWYTFRNARWPELVLRTASLSTNSAIYAVEDVADESRFSLVLPPRGRQDPAFLVYSKKWDGGVLHANNDNGDEDQQKQAMCTYIVNSGISSSLPMTQLLMLIQIAPERQSDGSPLFLLKSFSKNRFIYVGMTTTSMSGLQLWEGDPGAGGYWHIDPPLPQDVLEHLAPFSGRRCSSMCGSVAAVISAAPRVSGAARAFVLAIAAGALSARA